MAKEEASSCPQSTGLLVYLFVGFWELINWLFGIIAEKCRNSGVILGKKLPFFDKMKPLG